MLLLLLWEAIIVIVVTVVKLLGTSSSSSSDCSGSCTSSPGKATCWNCGYGGVNCLVGYACDSVALLTAPGCGSNA